MTSTRLLSDTKATRPCVSRRLGKERQGLEGRVRTGKACTVSERRVWDLRWQEKGQGQGSHRNGKGQGKARQRQRPVEERQGKAAKIQGKAAKGQGK